MTAPAPVDPADYTAAKLGRIWLTADEAAALIASENPLAEVRRTPLSKPRLAAPWQALRTPPRLAPFGRAAIKAGGAVRVLSSPWAWKVARRDNGATPRHVTLVLPEGDHPASYVWPVQRLITLEADFDTDWVWEFARILLEAGADVIHSLLPYHDRIVPEYTT